MLEVLIYCALIVVWLILIFVIKKKPLRKVFIIVVTVQVMTGILVIVLGLYLTKDEFEPLLVENAEFDADKYDKYELSKDQNEILDTYGELTGFTIMYTGDTYEDRLETWYFVESGMIVEFFNGNILSQSTDDMLLDIKHQLTEYQPEDFIFGLTPGTTLQAARIKDFLILPVEEELIESSKLYFGEDIVFGFVEDKLCYVETLLVSE